MRRPRRPSTRPSRRTVQESVARWKAVEAVQRRETRALSLEARLRLAASAREFGRLAGADVSPRRPDDPDVQPVMRNWRKLRAGAS